jgi:hypothetical protein
LDADFQQTYQAAEHAYGGGDYKTAHHLASGLLKQLETEERADDDQLRDAVLGWRAFVALLLGHIELHGRQRPDQAANYYQLTLDCQPQDTLAELARQGLQRSKSARKDTFNANVEEPTTPPSSDGESSTGSLPSMLQDPFLTNTPPVSTSAPSQSTAMPWLTKVNSPPQARETPAPEPKQTDPSVRSNPDTSEPVISAHEEPSHKEQPLPLLIPEESLERAWLRVSITPNRTRSDSIPMDRAKPSSRLKRLWQGLNRS